MLAFPRTQLTAVYMKSILQRVTHHHRTAAFISSISAGRLPRSCVPAVAAGVAAARFWRPGSRIQAVSVDSGAAAPIAKPGGMDGEQPSTSGRNVPVLDRDAFKQQLTVPARRVPVKKINTLMKSFHE